MQSPLEDEDALYTSFTGDDPVLEEDKIAEEEVEEEVEEEGALYTTLLGTNL